MKTTCDVNVIGYPLSDSRKAVLLGSASSHSKRLLIIAANRRYHEQR